MQGRIKSLTSRGFGFIEVGDIDFFVHYKDYNGNWKQLLARYVANEIITVSFEVDTQNTQGPKAKEVNFVSSLRKEDVI